MDIWVRFSEGIFKLISVELLRADNKLAVRYWRDEDHVQSKEISKESGAAIQQALDRVQAAIAEGRVIDFDIL